MTTDREWWGADVVPRIRWSIVLERFTRYAPEGGGVPNGYGVAWRQPGRDAVVLMPLPINLIARAIRECWYAMLFPHWGRADAMSFVFERGRKQGLIDAQTR